MEKTDTELMIAVQAGSTEAFRTLYGRYNAKLFNYLYYLLGNRQSAEDALQELFLKLYQKASRFDPRLKFSSWLYRMGRNIALDVLRKNKVRRAVSLDAETGEDMPSLAEMLPSGDAGPAAVAESRELAARVHEAIQRLEADERQLILLCDIQELSNPEAADVLELPLPRLAVKLHRARKRLGTILKEMIGDKPGGT